MIPSDANHNLNIDSLVNEYSVSIREFSDKTLESGLDRLSMINNLKKNHEWTDEGAEVICELAMKYGSFMLKNALAFSLALGIEDGELNF